MAIMAQERLDELIAADQEVQPVCLPYPYPKYKPWLCCICDHLAAPWKPYFCCRHWPSGEADNPWERAFNDWFTEGEARVMWPLYHLALNGPGVPIPPFPLDRSPRTTTPGTGLFNRVKAAVPVEALAGRFTRLQSSGPDRLKGKCPLHEERTASFYVYQDKGRWRCFGACARGGDVVELARCLMDLGKLP